MKPILILNLFVLSISYSFQPANRDELDDAIDSYVGNEETAINIYGHINTWDVSLITEMDDLFLNIYFNDDISNWDVSNVTNMSRMFEFAGVSGGPFNGDLSNWDVSSVTNMSRMFYNTSSFDGDLSNWDVSNVADMSSMFESTDAFNQDISNWDVSSVTNMWRMFFYADSFNIDLPNWDVSNVTSMEYMFCGADSFNGDISNWDVSNVTSMEYMFYHATSFNGDVSNWDVSNVASMGGMFWDATSFNGDLSDWDVSSVTNMRDMFSGATSFNGDLSDWDVSNVADMSAMFISATSFNGDVSNWDVSNVASMFGMFWNATSFNGDISNWDVSNFEIMQDMFHGATSFNGDLSDWDVSSVTNMSRMFYYATSFNGDLSDWDVSSVTNMSRMFEGTDAFDQDISPWIITAVTNMDSIFKDNVLSNANKCAIDSSFSSNSAWPYEWENFCSGFITIEDIENQSTNEDEPININIEAYSFLSDELTYFAESDTLAMPVYIDGTSIAIGLEANWNGIGTITVTVTDENQLSDTTDFTVTVLPVNDAPQDFDLVFPTIVDTIQISTDTDETVAFHWEESVDVDSDVTYLTTVTLDYFGNVFTQEYESDTSSVSIPGYEWAVLMTNQNLERWTLQYNVKASDEEYEVVKEGEFVFQITSLSVDGSITPLTFSLYQNYPNPFNPITTLKYDLPKDSFVDVTVYDLLGNVVNNLINKNQNSGSKSVQWDATNNQGEPVSAGVYLYKIQAGEFSQTKKMILLK